MERSQFTTLKRRRRKKVWKLLTPINFFTVDTFSLLTNSSRAGTMAYISMYSGVASILFAQTKISREYPLVIFLQDLTVLTEKPQPAIDPVA